MERFGKEMMSGGLQEWTSKLTVSRRLQNNRIFCKRVRRSGASVKMVRENG